MGLSDDFGYKSDYDKAEETGISDDDALALIGRLCSRYRNNDRGKNLSKLRDYLKNRLPDILGSSALHDENLKREFSELDHLKAAWLENCRLPMLRGKPVVGIGGAFSAGKSRFLNTLTGLEDLPEDQDPTTAIGTYLIHDNKFAIHAHTKNNGLESLKREELQAISHKFHDAYKIGFADILHKLIITSPSFRSDINLLDTPGYNKPKGQEEQELIDRRIAREHLKNSDYLIWLVDSAQGALTETDITFLKELELTKPLLVVFNKADAREDKVDEIVARTEQLLKEKNIPVFGVTAYSSAFKKEYLGRNMINEFLDLAAKSTPFSESRELHRLTRSWLQSFEQQQNNLDKAMAIIRGAVVNSNNVAYIHSLLSCYGAMSGKNTRLYYDKQHFEIEMDKFKKDMEEFS